MGGESYRTMSCCSPRYPTHVAHPVGKKITGIYKDRLGQFLNDGQYKNQSLRSKFYQGRASGDDHVQLQVYSPPDATRPTFKDATSHEFKKTHVGESFGPSWSTHWFRVTIAIPKELRDKEHLEFHWDANNEGMIWTEDGEIVHGLTGGGERVEWILPESWRDGKKHTFYVEMACNGMFGNASGDLIQPPPPDRYYTLRTADIVAVSLAARMLHIDFWEIGDAAREFPQDSWEQHKALETCNAIIDEFIAGEGSDAALKKCREIARTYTGNVDSSKVYDRKEEELVTAIGHCHIDTCWLWPWAETKRKVARSWSNQCDLIDRYPEYRFTASQAQQYKWLQMYYPSLFDRVKERVKDGSFQPIGGSWVEHDTNMPSGESLSRQFIYGQRFFESHFGQRCKTFWLPDTFGYSAQLPQLCRLAGMSNFLTQKLSWNNINKFPHTTFNWVALDGTQVMCHMPPSETYTADAHFGDVTRSISQHKSMDQDPSSMLVFGKGDGGGGPTWEMLEKLRRLRGIADKTSRMPRVKLGNSVDDFFDRLQVKAEKGTDFVTWYGELYFELHRGTYTTQANNKLNNRKTEFLLRDIEWLATFASIQSDSSSGSGKKYRYPKKEIDFMWEGVLLCQFHDCLPGSSIEMCYDDSDELYSQIYKTGEKCLIEALDALGYTLSTGVGEQLALNTLPWDRSEIISSPGQPQLAATGNSAIIAARSDVQLENRPAVSITQHAPDAFVLENAYFTVKVNDGVITSLYDRNAQREVIAKGGKANQFVIFDDKPLYWQAWDVEVFHLESRKELKSGKTYISAQSNTQVSLTTEIKISDKSSLTSTITLSAATSHASTTSTSSTETINISIDVDWHETMKFLKVEFPVDVLNTEASYEMQYGIVRRPTHYNTSWDMAKFEVCCHKWADLSEANYGVSILNDSKYGFATVGNLMRLSLLRAPKAPDAHADMGKHYVKYAILPHAGPLSYKTVRAGYAFNNPMRLVTPSATSSLRTLERTQNLLSSLRITGSDSTSLILDTIKRGEDDPDVVYKDNITSGNLPVSKDRSIIVRIYDSMGGRSRGMLEWNSDVLSIKAVRRCNLLEDDGEELKVVDGKENGKGGVGIELRAFEVASYKLVLA